MKTPHSLTFGKKIDGYIASEYDWDKWKEEFWEQEAKIIYETTLTSKKSRLYFKKQGKKRANSTRSFL